MIIRKVRSNRYITLERLISEIEREIMLYEDSEDIGISRRTIQRDYKEIEKIFKIEIAYSRSNRGYYIVDENEMDIERQLKHFDLLGTLDNDLQKIVFPERKEVKGTEYLYPLISAIKKLKVIEFRYRKFDNTVTKERRIVLPYALKEFKNRWYLLAVEIGGRPEERGRIKTWGLDRIENFRITEKLFDKDPNIEIAKEFENCFGIFTDDDKEAEEVILSFTPIGGKYNHSLPLHSSQESLIDNENEFRIKLKVKITYDFKMELLSQSETMKVISPAHLRDELIEIYKNAIKQL